MWNNCLFSGCFAWKPHKSPLLYHRPIKLCWKHWRFCYLFWVLNSGKVEFWWETYREFVVHEKKYSLDCTAGEDEGISGYFQCAIFQLINETDTKTFFCDELYNPCLRFIIPMPQWSRFLLLHLPHAGSQCYPSAVLKTRQNHCLSAGLVTFITCPPCQKVARPHTDFTLKSSQIYEKLPLRRTGCVSYLPAHIIFYPVSGGQTGSIVNTVIGAQLINY